MYSSICAYMPTCAYYIAIHAESVCVNEHSQYAYIYIYICICADIHSPVYVYILVRTFTVLLMATPVQDVFDNVQS